MTTEPPPILYWMRVINKSAQDYTRLGMLVDILDEFPVRVFVVLIDGMQTAFFPDEVEKAYAC